ncbi:YopX family protein [Vagococcus fluvialis]|uniref:YopX family protein n=1 Tax=Vagococcus fluvialis TaxID=2738 RepID=UPI001D0B43CA|nr:YopX family protein [Vagococcus fluvialis]UDM72417.1 YopX family protein [Vagococcus fluvialis]UDM77282.1 YopX family protein [Vagococcus fluvialis]UDM81552.1 YopX family protein [Vagococcus fluvialis]
MKYRAWDNEKQKMYEVGKEPNIHFEFTEHGIRGIDMMRSDGKGGFKVLDHLIYMQDSGMKDNQEVPNPIVANDIVKKYVHSYSNYYAEGPGGIGLGVQETHFEGYHYGIVKYRPSRGFFLQVFMTEDEFDGSFKPYKTDGDITQYRSEVIGNIFENPELLELPKEVVSA